MAEVSFHLLSYRSMRRLWDTYWFGICVRCKNDKWFDIHHQIRRLHGACVCVCSCDFSMGKKEEEKKTFWPIHNDDIECQFISQMYRHRKCIWFIDSALFICTSLLHGIGEREREKEKLLLKTFHLLLVFYIHRKKECLVSSPSPSPSPCPRTKPCRYKMVSTIA